MANRNVALTTRFPDQESPKDKKKRSKSNERKPDDPLNQSDLVKKSHFTYEQIQALSKIYARLTSEGKMDRHRFREFVYSTFDINDDVILDRMFSVFSEDTGTVSEIQWILGMSVLTRGTLEEKIYYAFQIYDMNAEGTISREEVDHFLRSCMSSSFGLSGLDVDDLADGVKDIGDIIFRKLDIDRNSLITFDDFYEACMNDQLHLESLGQCLPSDIHIRSFLVLFADDFNNFSTIAMASSTGGRKSGPKDQSVSQSRSTIMATFGSRVHRKQSRGQMAKRKSGVSGTISVKSF